MTDLVLVTSAINTRFGKFSPEVRCSQTAATLESIVEKMPTADIHIVECSVPEVLDEHIDYLKNIANFTLDKWGTNDDVVNISQSNNWDLVKNYTEMLCTVYSLRKLDYLDYSRIFKLSGRYVLNDHFDYSAHDGAPVALSAKRPSHFTPGLVPSEYQYMSRLWSWQAELTPTIIGVYERAIVEMASQISGGKYLDIEHALYMFLPNNLIRELPVIGVQGQLGPNGITVMD